MRIAMIGTRGLLRRYSGIETVLCELCPRLVAHGHAVTVFGGRTAAGTFEGVDIERVPVVPTKYLETLTGALLATRRAAARRFDIIHFHDVAAGVFAPLAAAAGIPTVLTLHSLDWQRAKWPAPAQRCIRALERRAVHGARAVTVVSESLQRHLHRDYDVPSTFLPNAVTLSPIAAPSQFSRRLGLEPQRYILFAARLVPEKAPHELIDAFKRIETDCKLVIAGEGQYGDRYASELHARARGHDIVFAGHVSGEDLHELYSNASVFVLPSRVEGRSLAVLEAMAHGCRALVSDIAANLELVARDVWAYRTGDAADLAAKLAQLLSDPEDVAARRARVREHVLQLPSWGAVAAGYERVYASVLSRRADAARD